MGSGHILVYAFEVLMEIYKSQGYSERDAAQEIVKNNLYGLELDDRAAQLAYFAVMMKARSYDRRFLTRGIYPHLCSIQESNSLNTDYLELFGELKPTAQKLVDEFIDAKEYGSILNLKISADEIAQLESKYNEINDAEYDNVFNTIRQIGLRTVFVPLIRQAKIMVKKYNVVCTNPPYMGGSGMSAKLSAFVKKNYPDSKADLFAVFMEKCIEYAAQGCYSAMITMHNWMFIDSFWELRKSLIESTTTVSLIHLGIKAFEFIGNDIVQTCAFCQRKETNVDYNSTFVRLVDVKNYEEKQIQFFNDNHYFVSKVKLFLEAPTVPYAYWVSKEFFNNFSNGKKLSHFGTLTGSKNITGNNDKYLRQFWEVKFQTIQKGYWVPYAKGGFFRKYYGNITCVVDWRSNARWFYETNKTSNLLNQEFWYKEGITYSAVTSRGTGFRYFPQDCLFDYGGPVINIFSEYLYQFLGFYNSKIAEYYFRVLNPSVNLQTKDLRSIPYIIPNDKNLVNLVKMQVAIAKQDWAENETTFEFVKNPLIALQETSSKNTIQELLKDYKANIQRRYAEFEKNELEINEIYMRAYNLSIPVQFERRDISVKDMVVKNECVALISYAVGCMFGRYSVNAEGLQFAGGDWTTWYDANRQMLTANGYTIDPDNIIPICDDDYFDDDIVGLFVDFVRKTYGEDTLEENLRFVADALGGKGTAREVIRKYFLNDFYKDHCKIYQKRPIYWLFSSGKKNGFKALIYLHRYQPDQLARMRTDYVHEQQERYRTQLQMSEESLSSAAPSEKVKLNKRIAKLKDQALELQKYEEKIHHLADQMIPLDLDDGVKVNYAKFGDVLEKIK